jgi:hypothetical protein
MNARWVRNENFKGPKNFCIYTVSFGGMMKSVTPKLIVLRRKPNKNVPYIGGAYVFGNFIIQVMLPYCSLIQEEINYTMPFYLPKVTKEFCDDYGYPKCTQSMVSIETPMKTKQPSMTFRHYGYTKYSDNKEESYDASDYYMEHNVPGIITIIGKDGSNDEYNDFLCTCGKNFFKCTSMSSPLELTVTLASDWNISVVVEVADNGWNNESLKNLRGFDLIEKIFRAKSINFSYENIPDTYSKFPEEILGSYIFN